ncbi:MAG: glycine reductase, partial [Actinomycetota bacterium]|nr:glycine reductase [Actinomycetota bacterium]
MSSMPVISGAAQVLAHAPGLARHGSKPRRELPRDGEVERSFLASLRTFEQAVAYPPHQAYLGAIHPRSLPERPWYTTTDAEASRFASAGELMPEAELLGLLAAVDHFDLLTLDQEVAGEAAAALAGHPLAKHLDLERIERAVGDVGKVATEPGSIPVHLGAHRLAG